MAAIGKVSIFDTRSGVWTSYIERLEMYFKVNKVAEDLKLPTLIAVMGDEAYELLVNLASPKKPADLNFKDAVSMMQKHLQPLPAALAERYRFRQKKQMAGESVAQYITELRKLSRLCAFGSYLDENLRDQFVCGLKCDIIRQRLFTEGEVALSKAISLATSLEAAERDAAAVDVSTSSTPVHSVSARERAGAAGEGVRARAEGAAGSRDSTRGREKQDMRAREPRGAAGPACAACGDRYHKVDTCRFRDFRCHACQRRGHLQRACPDKSRGSGSQGAGHRFQPRGRNAAGRGFFYADEVQHDDFAEEPAFEEDLHQLCLGDYSAI